MKIEGLREVQNKTLLIPLDCPIADIYLLRTFCSRALSYLRSVISARNIKIWKWTLLFLTEAFMSSSAKTFQGNNQILFTSFKSTVDLRLLRTSEQKSCKNYLTNWLAFLRCLRFLWQFVIFLLAFSAWFRSWSKTLNIC